MMQMRNSILLAVLALAACGPTEERVVNTAPEENLVNAATGTSDVDTIAAMNDGARRLTFARMLAQQDLPCDGVVKAELVGKEQGNPVWRATCKSGTAYALTIQPDGNATVMARPR
jgi:hypothetical protein